MFDLNGNRISICLTSVLVFVSCDNCKFQNRRNMKEYSGVVLEFL
ncbi:hypothetical protein SAMN06265367_101893 [Algoriphagus winogradskyi]|uniref:Lipoprotein n=1 Tax=Algoriphagus winogradskyi TaxID=237017 RepID=A0ABY1NH86_9BACT|nr:hypothetical protein SAMN06265367_101893 [Algoriphagus winogradskyi]